MSVVLRELYRECCSKRNVERELYREGCTKRVISIVQYHEAGFTESDVPRVFYQEGLYQ